MRNLVLMLMLVAPVGGFAQPCPALPDQETEKSSLLQDLAKAETEAAGFQIADHLWRIWTTAPDAEAQDLLDRGMARREAHDLAGAEAILDDLIAYCPDYPEGYNQRAFVRFLREDFDAALADLNRVIAADPNHFGALSGRALVLIGQNRVDLGQAALRRALQVHPWLRERGMLLPGTGNDI